MVGGRPCRPAVPARLQALFDEEGLDLLGISATSAAPEAERAYRAWLDSGRHGGMHYLVDHADKKYRPADILPGCRSILSVGSSYYQRADWRPGLLLSSRAGTDVSPSVRSAPPSGRVARYAWGRDYHRALGKRLSRITKELRRMFPGEEFRSFTDATPLAERHYGESAGIGFTGRNTLLINPEYGSWFFVGEVLSTVEFPPSRAGTGRAGACPRSCRRCIGVCPTGALEAPHQIDARRCISYLTIELSGSIPVELRPKIGDWLFGCDLCQEVCPLNVRARVTGVEDFRVHRAGSRLELEELMGIHGRQEFVNRFAGTPLMRPGREGIVRNACIVAGNLADPALLPHLRGLFTDKSSVVREAARWAADRILASSTARYH